LTAATSSHYDKIIFPPQGVVACGRMPTRGGRVDAPTEYRDVKLKLVGSLLDNLASPWNVIYPKKYLTRIQLLQDQRVGSGPSDSKILARFYVEGRGTPTIS